MNRSSPNNPPVMMPGAAYIRYSSNMQDDSFSLDAQLRQIKEQAARDGVEVVKVFSDPAQSAYSKKYRPGIVAMREAARCGEFQILYVHKVDRLARRLEWSLEIVHELQSLNIDFKAVEQPFDLRTPEGKLLFHLVSSLGEFYSDNLSKETNKGKLEGSIQGYHNGAVPWGYVSEKKERRKVGVPDPQKAPVVVEMFERYASGIYSDMQIADWLNSLGYHTNRSQPFGKDTVRDMLCNPYYVGRIRYRGMSVRPKAVSFRSTPPKVSKGQHEAIITEDLWERAQRARESRRVLIRSVKLTSRVNLLQSLVVCVYCGRRLRVQTPKNCKTYYREDSHLRGYHDCPYIGMSIQADILDAQIAALIQSLKFPENWEKMITEMLQNTSEDKQEDERGEIRTTLRLMRENYERGLYEGDEFVYWQKVNALKEKLEILNRVPEKAIDRAARTFTDLSGSWEWATQEERKELVQMMIQQVGCDVSTKQVLWIKARPDFYILFQVLGHMQPDDENRYWLVPPETLADITETREDNGQKGTGGKSLIILTNNSLTTTQE